MPQRDHRAVCGHPRRGHIVELRGNGPHCEYREHHPANGHRHGGLRYSKGSPSSFLRGCTRRTKVRADRHLALFGPNIRQDPQAAQCQNTPTAQAENARILLVNLLQSSRSTFSWGSSSDFLPSKKACWAHQFRYLGVDQQYPPVMCTRDERGISPGVLYPETRSINQC
jgi:hypothetical protein